MEKQKMVIVGPAKGKPGKVQVKIVGDNKKQTKTFKKLEDAEKFGRHYASENNTEYAQQRLRNTNKGKKGTFHEKDTLGKSHESKAKDTEY
jgi:hypothetical protein